MLQTHFTMFIFFPYILTFILFLYHSSSIKLFIRLRWVVWCQFMIVISVSNIDIASQYWSWMTIIILFFLFVSLFVVINSLNTGIWNVSWHGSMMVELLHLFTMVLIVIFTYLLGSCTCRYDIFWEWVVSLVWWRLFQSILINEIIQFIIVFLPYYGCFNPLLLDLSNSSLCMRLLS